MPEILYDINPDRDLPWNNLPLLPIRKELYHTTEILEKLGNAKAALARLQGRSVVIPDQGMLINTISLQEAKSSSAIENIFTTDDDLYKAYSNSNLETSGTAKEVLRYREALWSGYNYLKNNSVVDTDYLIGIFREVKQTGEGIRPDFVNTTIRAGGEGPGAGRVVYTPPRGVAVIQNKLDNLVQFLNNDELYPIDHLLKMAISHFQFEAIHPFRDGNGRVGRILNINYLTSKGLLDYPILFHSRYILKHKDEYYKTLSGVSQKGDWNKWILFMLNAIESTSNHTYSKINEIVSARDSILDYLKKGESRFRNLEKLVDLIFTQPFTKVKHLTDSGNYAENTARDYLNRLCEIHVLEKKVIDGHHYYLNLELHRILSE
jgi:Fic family protein